MDQPMSEYVCAYIINRSSKLIQGKWDGVTYDIPPKAIIPLPQFMCAKYSSEFDQIEMLMPNEVEVKVKAEEKPKKKPGRPPKKKVEEEKAAE